MASLFRSSTNLNLLTIFLLLLLVFLPKASMVLQQSISNQTQFSTTLATHLLTNKYDNSNVVFSPLSIHVVLSQLAAGSGGQTRDQILGFLKTNTTDDLNSLYSHLVPWIFADGSPNGGPVLSIANGVWIDKTFSFIPSFKQVLDTVHKAVWKEVDFQNKAVEVADKVNLWAEKQTCGLIKQVLPANAVNDLTRLILANAIYFKGEWSQKFNRIMTKRSDFHLLDGNKVKVPFMTNTLEKQLVRKYDHFTVLGLPYLQGQDKRKFTMYFFLPDEKNGLQSLVEKIGSASDFFDRHIPDKKVEVGRFLIPKFKISFKFEASEMLKELGLVLPFSDAGDFTKMVNSTLGEKISVESVHHKSFIKVNEEGSEAAASSAASAVLCCSMPGVEVDFVADHPFLFVVREDVSGVVLFMGQVVDPRVG